MSASRVLLAVLLVATWFAFAPALNGEYLTIDDIHYLWAQPHVATGLSWENVRWAFSTVWLANYAPLTWISHQTLVTFAGEDQYWHHAVNLVLHLANVVLLYVVLRRATGSVWQSLTVAAIWAVHPLRVEAVAWISSRKDVLSTFFGLLAILSYLSWVERRGLLRYLGVCLGMTASLLVKPMFVSLPILLLLLDRWPLARPEPWLTRVWEKTPLALISAASCAGAIYAQLYGDGLISAYMIPVDYRIANAGVSLVSYLIGLFRPDPVAFYPLIIDLQQSQALFAAGVLLAITLTVMLRRYAQVGWAWYLISVLPVLGLLQNGSQRIADRYTYVPSIGLLIILVWGAFELVGRHRALLIAPVLAILIASGSMTREYSRQWQTSVGLYSYSYAHRPCAPAAELVGMAYLNEGDLGAARFYLQQAIDADPYRSTALVRLAALVLNDGDIEEGKRLLDRVSVSTIGEPASRSEWTTIYHGLRDWIDRHEPRVGDS